MAGWSQPIIQKELGCQPLDKILNKTIQQLRQQLAHGELLAGPRFTYSYLKFLYFEHKDLYHILETHPNKETAGYFTTLIMSALRKFNIRDPTLQGYRRYEDFYYTTELKSSTLNTTSGNVYKIKIKI